jgi:probable HAF family extracellular repeat protein
MRRKGRIAAILALASPVCAQSFTGLGTPAGGYSEADGLSADGLTAVGWHFSPLAPLAFRWTAQSGRVSLPLAATYTSSYASGASADGSAIAGYLEKPGGYTMAVRWVGGAAPQLLGALPGGVLGSAAIGVSRNGLIVVGTSDHDFAFGPRHAFRWMNGSMIDLGDIPAPPGYFCPDLVAAAVSDDGSVIVGSANDLGGGYRAFRWTPAGMIDLGSLGPLDHNGASDVSADGAIIVGVSNELPFRWTAGTGMVALPLPVGVESGSAAAITAGGSVILGVAIGTTNQLVYWDASGVHDLGAALGAAVPAGWVLQRVSGISDDGRTFSGWGLHNGVYEAWVAMLAAGGCYPNCDASTASPILNVATSVL